MSSSTSDDLLFEPRLIPEQIVKSLPDDLQIRPLSSTDITRGHFSVLSVLSPSPTPSLEAYKDHFKVLQTINASTTASSFTNPLAKAPTYLVIAIVNKQNDQIVATGSLVMERKFLRGLSLVGHIEDIAVDKNVQGKRLGWRVVMALTEISEALGAYKTILNCSTANIPFYEKCGYKPKENEMARYKETPAIPIQKL